MATLNDILKQYRRNYDLDMPNAQNQFDAANSLSSQFVNSIIQSQKAQRSAPYAEELASLSQQWDQSEPDNQKVLNERANAARAAYIAAGGSPRDLDRSLWGADPSQGFQTGGEQFTPSYAGDNLTMAQKIKLSGVTGLFEGKPTLEAKMKELQAAIDLARAKNSGSGGSKITEGEIRRIGMAQATNEAKNELTYAYAQGGKAAADAFIKQYMPGEEAQLQEAYKQGGWAGVMNYFDTVLEPDNHAITGYKAALNDQYQRGANQYMQASVPQIKGKIYQKYGTQIEAMGGNMDTIIKQILGMAGVEKNSGTDIVEDKAKEAGL